MLLDLRGSIPSFIHISDGKLHDVKALDLFVPEPGAFYVMDRAYLDFDRVLQQPRIRPQPRAGASRPELRPCSSSPPSKPITSALP